MQYFIGTSLSVSVSPCLSLEGRSNGTSPLSSSARVPLSGLSSCISRYLVHYRAVPRYRPISVCSRSTSHPHLGSNRCQPAPGRTSCRLLIAASVSIYLILYFFVRFSSSTVLIFLSIHIFSFTFFSYFIATRLPLSISIASFRSICIVIRPVKFYDIDFSRRRTFHS